MSTRPRRYRGKARAGRPARQGGADASDARPPDRRPRPLFGPGRRGGADTGATPPPNPYVGPRSFRAGERLYGRDREARELEALLVAERIVLLYSPSGAGKTSLIQAMLLPRLAARDFFVRPVVRVSTEAPAPGANRYALSAMLSLEEGRPAEEQLPVEQLAALSLAAYLELRPPPPATDGDLLVFDQFEELLTADPTDGAAKLAFFEQLGAALQPRGRWALFAMREDYIAGLDPYLRLLPTRLAATFRLDLLGVAAARAAIQRPASEAGVAFEDAAAERLANDLSLVRVQQPDGSVATLPGPSVEPVQLQVVCFRLWERRFGQDAPPGPAAITLGDLGGDEGAAGDVDGALAGYYAERVARAAAASGVGERQIRAWFDRQLITPQGIRAQVLLGPDASAGLPAAAVPPLRDAYLVRAEPRRGALWLELAHDRLVAPVRASNAAWLAANLSTLQRQAALWEERGRPAGLLLSGADLAEAELWAAGGAELTPVEADYLALCREARAALERERSQAARIRRLALAAAGLAAVALLAFLTALWLYGRAEQQRREAERQAARNRAGALAAAGVGALPSDPERGLILAQAAVASAPPGEAPLPAAVDALHQAVQAPRPARTLAGHAMGLTSVAFRPDGAAVATGGNDGAVRIWPLSGGEPAILRLEADVLDLAYLPDGALAAADLDGVVRLWSPGGAELWSVALDAPAARLAASPDGGALAAATDAGEVLLLAAADGAELARLAPPAPADGGDPPPLYSVAFSPDGAALLAGDALGGVTLWELDGDPDPAGQALASPHRDIVEGAAWSPDGLGFATADASGLVALWDATSLEPAGELRGYTGGFADLAYSPDGLLLATAGADGVARLWELTGGTPLLALPGHADFVSAVAFSPDGLTLATASLDRTARLWSLALVPPDGAASVAWSPDGATLATGGAGTVRLWSATTGAPGPALPASGAGELVAALAFSPDGRRLAAAAGPLALVWDAASGAELVRLEGHADFVGRLAWSPDGALLATGGDDFALRVWDVASGAELYAADDHGFWVRGLAWSADGMRIATCDAAGGVFVRDAATGEALLTWELPDGSFCNALALSADGARLATAEPFGRAIVWDAATGDEVLRLAHPPEAADVAFSADGATLYTAGRDRSVRWWDAATGAQLGQLSTPAEPQELRLSPDGRRLAVTGADNLPRVYPLAYEDLLATARARPPRAPTAEECAAYGPLPGCP